MDEKKYTELFLESIKAMCGSILCSDNTRLNEFFDDYYKKGDLKAQDRLVMLYCHLIQKLEKGNLLDDLMREVIEEEIEMFGDDDLPF